MPLRPLAPMSPARIEWETQVTHHVCELAEVSNGDAQGILEADPDGVDKLFERGTPPLDAARDILDITCTPGPIGPTDEELVSTPADPIPAEVREQMTANLQRAWNLPARIEPEAFKPRPADPLPEVTLTPGLLEPMAEVGDSFVFFLRKRPDGSRWPKGTKLHAEHAVAALRDERNLLRDQRDALANELSATRFANENLSAETVKARTELEQVKRNNVGALASLAEAREQRDTLLKHLQFAVRLLDAMPALRCTAQVDAMRKAIVSAGGGAS